MSAHDPLQIYPSSYQSQPPIQYGLAERLATVEAHLSAARQAMLDAGTRMSGIDARITHALQEMNARINEQGERLHRERENRQADIEHARKNMHQVTSIIKDKMIADRSEMEKTIRNALITAILAISGAIVTNGPTLLELFRR